MNTQDIFAATKAGHIETIGTVLNRDSSLVHARDDNGATPLHNAALSGHRDVVRFLVVRGADVNAVDAEFGATPAGWAIEYLREQGRVLAIETEDLVYAIEQRDTRWVARLVERFPRLTTQVDARGISILEHAARTGDETIAALLAVIP